jgi:hypothetical protein
MRLKIQLVQCLCLCCVCELHLKGKTNNKAAGYNFKLNYSATGSSVPHVLTQPPQFPQTPCPAHFKNWQQHASVRPLI